MSEYGEDEAYVMVSFEGDVGAGKTTAMDKVQAALEAAGVPVEVAIEPVPEWVKAKVPNEEGEIDEHSETVNLLGRQYKTPSLRSAIQAHIYTTRVTEQRRAIRAAKKVNIETGKRVVILSERSRISDFEVFAKIGRFNGDIDDEGWIIYNGMRKENALITPDFKIYFRTDNGVCRQRMIARAREGEVEAAVEDEEEEEDVTKPDGVEDEEEAEVEEAVEVKCNIPLEYHQQVSSYHDKVFAKDGTHPADYQFDGTVSTDGMTDHAKRAHYAPLGQEILRWL